MTAAVVDEDRLVHDMPDADYRRYPAVSQSGLKTILDSPARYRWERDHPTIKDAYDFGHVVHGLVLGVGEPVARLDFPDRRSKAYKDAVAEAREVGAIPLLAATHDEAHACADAVFEHPLAGALIGRDGDSEVSLFWSDVESGVACKGRADRVTITDDGQHWLVDLKATGQTANPDRFGSTAASYGYHLQAAFYLDGYEQITGHRARFLNVLVETAAPHFVAVVELDDEALDVGRAKYRDALDIYARCRESGDWPGYTPAFTKVVSLPRWATYI